MNTFGASCMDIFQDEDCSNNEETCFQRYEISSRNWQFLISEKLESREESRLFVQSQHNL